MKILYVTFSPAPYRVDLLNEMNRECEVVAVYEKGSGEIRNRNPAWFEKKEDYRFLTMKECRLRGLADLVRKEGFDAAIVCGYAGIVQAVSLLSCRAAGIPVLLCADGMMEKKESLLKHMFKRYVISLADGCLVSGNYTEKRIREYGTGTKPVFSFPLTSVKENELTGFDKGKLREKYGIREKTVILAAGQFIDRKGYDLLLDCLPYLDRDTGVYLAGEKPPGSWEKLCALYPNLHFPGFVSHEELLERMTCCDIFVHPARYEVWGLAVSEAMMCGCCVVTTDRCGAGLELIRDGRNGRLVQAGNRKALLKILKELEKDEVKRMELGKQAEEETHGMTVEKAAEAHLSALQEVVGK